jgi:hypothetical protein
MQTISTADQSGQAQISPIRKGHRVRSVHAGRVGTAVKIYPDGSAAVCWDDGDPQPEGLAHERVPRALLEVPGPAVPSSAAKPDYQAESFSGPLVSDHFRNPGLVYATVEYRHVADVARSASAITTLARLVHNSLCEPGMTLAEPLGHAAHLGLLNAIEIVGSYLEEASHLMCETATDLAVDDTLEDERHG